MGMLERLLALLGISRQRDEWLSDDDLKPYGEEGQTSKSSPQRAALVFCRGVICVERREDLAEALHNGQIIIVDLRNVDKGEGQSALDFICGVAYAMRGVVMRIAPAVFLATPDRNLVELWEEEKGVAHNHE